LKTSKVNPPKTKVINLKAENLRKLSKPQLNTKYNQLLKEEKREFLRVNSRIEKIENAKYKLKVETSKNNQDIDKNKLNVLNTVENELFNEKKVIKKKFEERKQLLGKISRENSP